MNSQESIIDQTMTLLDDGFKIIIITHTFIKIMSVNTEEVISTEGRTTMITSDKGLIVCPREARLTVKSYQIEENKLQVILSV